MKSTKKIQRALSFSLALVMTFSFSGVTNVFATDVTVTSMADLSTEITNANANPGLDTINIGEDPSGVVYGISNTNGITLPTITDDLIIKSAMVGDTHLIDANGTQVFTVASPNPQAPITVTIQDLIIGNAMAPQGAVINSTDANIVLNRCDFINNTSDMGSVVSMTGGTLTSFRTDYFQNSDTSSTTSSGQGAIYATPSSTTGAAININIGTFTGNDSGGIFLDGSNVSLTYSDTTMLSNDIYGVTDIGYSGTPTVTPVGTNNSISLMQTGLVPANDTDFTNLAITANSTSAAAVQSGEWFDVNITASGSGLLFNSHAGDSYADLAGELYVTISTTAPSGSRINYRNDVINITNNSVDYSYEMQIVSPVDYTATITVKTLSDPTPMQASCTVAVDVNAPTGSGYIYSGNDGSTTDGDEYSTVYAKDVEQEQTTSTNEPDDLSNVDTDLDPDTYTFEGGNDPLMNGDPDGNFRPEDTLTRAEVATVLYTSLYEGEGLDPATEFSDVSSDMWYSDAINFASSNGLMVGYPDETFGPNDPVTRAEVLVVFDNVMEYPNYSGDAMFTDTADHWASEQINAAAAGMGLTGYPDGSFMPDSNISRGDFAIMLAKATNRVDYDTSVTFNDVSPDDYYYEYIMAVTNTAM